MMGKLDEWLNQVHIAVYCSSDWSITQALHQSSNGYFIPAMDKTDDLRHLLGGRIRNIFPLCGLSSDFRY